VDFVPCATERDHGDSAPRLRVCWDGLLLDCHSPEPNLRVFRPEHRRRAAPTSGWSALEMSWQVVICTGGGATMTPMNDYSAPKIIIRRARTSDVRPIKALIDIYAGKVLLAKELVTLYEDLQEFWVAELNGRIVGCGALHVLWEDIAEIRTVAVAREEVGGVERNGRSVGCGAVHVLWEDIAEIRTVAVDPAVKGRGVGHLLVTRLIDLARELGLERIFVLTFETEFFGRHGFKPIDGTPVSPEVYEE